MNRTVLLCRMALSQFLLLLLVAASGPRALAAADPVAAGADWLEAHQDGLGGWDAWEPPHGFTLQALNETSYQAAPAYGRLRDRVLATQSPGGNWTDSHYPVVGLIETGMSPTAPQVIQALAGLHEVQKADGSWNGNIIDTCLAIGSFVAANQAEAAPVQSAIAWIKAAQNADGGWGYKPGDSSDFNTYYACLALAQAAPSDAALTGCRAWINKRFTVSTLPCEIAIEIEALIAIGDLAKAQTAAAGLAAGQNAGGSWFLYPGIATPYSTARGVTALRRARQAGISGLDQNIAAGSQWVLDCIDANGDPRGRYEQVIETAEATMALIAAGRAGQPSVTGAHYRLDNVPNPYYYWDFIYNGGCYEATGWGLAALAQSGGSAARIQGVVNTLLSSQAYPIGYWYRPDNVTYTVHALIGLADAGQAGNGQFILGMDWLEAAYRAGATFSTTDKALTLYAVRGSTRWAVLRNDLIADLAAIQNADGGWGEAAGQASRIDTTAAIVIGLQDIGYHSVPLSRGRAFLAAFQNSDGGWPEAAGLLESQTGPTALAVWALGEADTTGEIAVTVSTDKNVYASGQTVLINAATSAADPDTVEGSIIDSHGARTPLLIARVDATHFMTQYTIPPDQPSDRFVVEITATKGSSFGVGSAGFEIGLFRPVNISPADGASILTLTPTLVASDFHLSGATHAASRWQAREASGPSDWSDLAFDSGERSDALTSITLPLGSLRPDVSYMWRVSYKDNTSLWSAWSLPTQFTAMDAMSAGINWLVDHQSVLGGWEITTHNEPLTLDTLARAGQTGTTSYQRVLNRVFEFQYANGYFPLPERALYALLDAGRTVSDPKVSLGIKELKAHMAPDGSLNGMVDQTAWATRALVKAGAHPEAAAAVIWLRSVQAANGGFSDRPGGSPDGAFTSLALLALVEAVGKNDPAAQAAWSFYCSHPLGSGSWGAPHALEACVKMNDLSRASSLASAIRSAQLSDGSWAMVAGTGSTIQTANNVAALCWARSAGVSGLDQTISKGLAYLNGCVQEDGSVLDNGDNSRVYLSAFAARALISASDETEAINLCRARFATHSGSGWGTYFQLNNYTSWNGGLACMALSRLGDYGSVAAAQSTAAEMLAVQNGDGGWGPFNGSESSLDSTAMVLLALAETGHRSDPKFVSGANYILNGILGGKVLANSYQGVTLIALGSDAAYNQLRASLVQSLTASQNPDGGWGELPSTQSRVDSTAWALLGLNAAGSAGRNIDAGRQWLMEQQKNNGSWGEYPGGLAGMVDMTGLAVWALSEVPASTTLPMQLLTDRRSYVGGETVRISVTCGEADPDTIQGSVTDPHGARTNLTFSKIDSTHFSAEYAIPAAQWPGAFIAAASATKGELYGAAARGFEVGLFRPINILPRDAVTSVSLAPTLRASDFDASTTLADHVASQWQVRDLSSPPGYSSVIFDSGVDTAHLTSITMPLGRLLYSSNYAWTVRYKDSLGRWSAWSIETSFGTLAASQFGERLVFDMDGDIWIANTSGIGEPTRLTAGPARDTCPRISPDGQWVAFSSDQNGQYQIWLMHPDGSGARPIGGFQSGNPICLDWSPGSSSLVASATGDTIHIVPVNGSGSTQIAFYPLVQVRQLAWSTQNKIAIEMSPFGNPSYSVICSVNPDGTGLVNLVSGGHAPAWTPDGSVLAAGINNDIWTVNANGTGLTRRIGGTDVETVPAWTNDASSMFYRSYPATNPGVSTIMAAAADGSETVTLKYYNAAIGSMDIGTVAVGSNLPPAQPALLEPAVGAANVSLVPTLKTSAFSDPNPGDTHGSTHWQVRLASESYDSAVVNQASATELIQYAIEAGQLVPGQHYFWRARYSDNHGNISPWSAERSFTTVATAAPVNDRILIVAGGGPFTGNSIVEQTKFLAGYAWRMSRNRQVPAGQIQFLSAFPVIDANGDGANDVSAAATRQSLLTALNPTVGFAADCDKLIVYMVDHGSRNSDGYYFRINPTETISAAELDMALDALQAARPTMKIAVVCDFCYSGGFVIGTQPQAGQQRICVSGSTQESLAIFSGTIAGVSFSNFFFDNLAAGATFKTAFDTAYEGVIAAYSGPPIYPLQVPWLEDNGDGRISNKDDGALARTFYWGCTAAYGMTPPQIIAVTPDQHVTSPNVKLSTELAAGFTIERVWVTIVSPTTTYIGDQPITSMREVDLVREGSTRVWSANVTLAELGEHHVTFYARGYDSLTVAGHYTLQAGVPDSLISMPRPTVITRDAGRNGAGNNWMLYR